MGGRRLPKRLPAPELERHLQDVLVNWSDDAHLSASPLGDMIRDEQGRPPGPRPELLRQAIVRGLERAQARASEDQALAYRAIEMAYLEPSGTRAGAANRLAVSRRTFYRLLERGVRDLAALLSG